MEEALGHFQAQFAAAFADVDAEAEEAGQFGNDDYMSEAAAAIADGVAVAILPTEIRIPTMGPALIDT